jgi:hypothetical protein
VKQISLQRFNRFLVDIDIVFFNLKAFSDEIHNEEIFPGLCSVSKIDSVVIAFMEIPTFNKLVLISFLIRPNNAFHFAGENIVFGCFKQLDQ